MNNNENFNPMNGGNQGGQGSNFDIKNGMNGLNMGNLTGKLGKGCSGLGCLIAALAALVIWGISTYNGLVNDQQEVEKAWANVETQYQRRADLIDNLVNTVKGYAKHERETFEAVTNARTSVGSIKIDAENLDEEQLKKFQSAQNELSGALKSLIAVSENYPELKANENFLQLQSQLEGTENRIATVREDFNKVAKEYNTKIKQFPKNIFAGIFGFKEKPYFAAQAGAENAPKVSFD